MNMMTTIDRIDDDTAWAAVLRAAGQAGSVAAYCDGAALGTTRGFRW